MWFLALVTGAALAALLTLLAKRVFLSGRKTTGRLIAFVRGPAWFACLWWCFGLVRHEAAGPLVGQSLAGFGAGIAGRISYLLIISTYRAARIWRQRPSRATS